MPSARSTRATSGARSTTALAGRGHHGRHHRHVRRPGTITHHLRRLGRQGIATKVDLKATTRARYEGILRTNVLPQWRTVRLRDVTHGDVAAWIAVLTASGLAPSTVRQIHRVFSLSLTLAVRDGPLARNPADHVPLPRPRPRKKVFLTVDQVEDLAEAAGDYRVAILLLAYTGVRFGELSGVRVRRLDLLRRRAEIAAADFCGPRPS